MKLRPIGDRLIVRAVEEDDGSLLAPASRVGDRPRKGTVLAAGWAADIAEGDEVLYSKYGGTHISIDGEELLVLRESDVLANVGESHHTKTIPQMRARLARTPDAVLKDALTLNDLPGGTDEEPEQAIADEERARARVQDGLTRLRELIR